MNLNKSAVAVDVLVFSAPLQQRYKVCKEILPAEMISAQPGQAWFQVSAVGTAMTDHNCHRPQQFQFPSPCAQGMYPGHRFPNVYARGKMYTASSVLRFTILSRKLYSSVLCHSTWLFLPSDLPLTPNGIPVLLCECMNETCVSQPPKQTSCDVEEGQ